MTGTVSRATDGRSRCRECGDPALVSYSNDRKLLGRYCADCAAALGLGLSTVRDTAATYSVGESTVRRWLESGRLTPVRALVDGRERVYVYTGVVR